MGYTTGNDNENDNGSNKFLWFVIFLATLSALLLGGWLLLGA